MRAHIEDQLLEGQITLNEVQRKLKETLDELSMSRHLVATLRKEVTVRASPINMAMPPLQVNRQTIARLCRYAAHLCVK